MVATLVADNMDERDILTFILKRAGLTVTHCSDLNSATDKWLERPSDLVVVAWNQSDPRREDIVALRGVTQVPLMLILNTPTEADLCDLLRAGADLVLPRPVSPVVLSEYARSLLRRIHTVPTFVLPRLSFTGIRLDPDTRTVSVSGQEARRLTQLEFRLLYVLMINRGQVIPSDVIVERVWGYTGHGNRELVRGLVSRLRRKIEPQPRTPRYIQNVPGVGYRFSVDEE